MKTEFKAKFLQHLNQKKQDKGFTLIELLVVVIIIGILAAIALPSLLSQTNKAKQAEARQNIGAMNRAQQAYYLERQEWASGTGGINLLGVGIKSQTENFKYEIPTVASTATLVANQATPTKNNLKAYTGAVYTIASGAGTANEALTQALLCETLVTQTTAFVLNATDCGASAKDLGK